LPSNGRIPSRKAAGTKQMEEKYHDENNIDNNGENQNFENDEEKDITDNVNSELLQKYNLEYLNYQHKLLYIQRFLALIQLNQRIFNSLSII